MGCGVCALSAAVSHSQEVCGLSPAEPWLVLAIVSNHDQFIMD